MGWGLSIRGITDTARKHFFGQKTVSREGLSEEPRFEEVVVFYNRVFDLGAYVNPTEVARKLLEEDFALAAPNYLTNEVEVAARFKDLERLRSNMETLSEIQRNLDAAGARSMFRWALRHPVRALRLWRDVRSYRSSRSERPPSASKNVKTANRRTRDTLRDATRFVDEAMRRVGVFESLQRHVDRSLFKPQYLQEIPFTRIGLQPFYATIAGEEIGVDVGLLVHRTGVAILTFYVVFKGRKSAKELLEIESIAASPQFAKLKVAHAIAELQARSMGLGSVQLHEAPFEREYSSGIEWLTLRNEEKGSLVDVFDMYESAIASSLRGKLPSYFGEHSTWLRNPDWFIYPVVFAKRIIPAIADGKSFRQAYPEVIAGLIQRSYWRGLTEANVQSVVQEDLSIKRDYSLYVEAGHATVFYFESYWRKLMKAHDGNVPGQTWLYAHFQTSVVIDVLLIQRWILATLNRQLSSLTSDPTKLNNLKRDLLVALEEYHNVAISYVSAQEIVKRARKKMGTDELYQSVMQKLDILDRLIEAEETNRRAWRDRFLRAGTAVATLLFGLPAASRVTQIMTDWGIGLAVSRPIEVTVALYLTSVVLVLPWVLLSVWPLRGRKRVVETDQSQPAYTKGFAWGRGITWREKAVHEEEQDAADPGSEGPSK